MQSAEMLNPASLDSDSQKILKRSEAFLRDKKAPPTFMGRLIARYGAAWELGYDWRIPEDLKALWDADMLAWGDLEGDVDWWQESDRRRDLAAPMTVNPWRQAESEADIDAETAPGYKPPAGLASKFASLWAARAGYYREEHVDAPDAARLMAALNDLCRDFSPVGQHARRVRAGWLKRERWSP